MKTIGRKHKLLLDKMSIELDQMRWFKILKEFLELSNVIDVNSRVDEINEYIIQLREKLEESQKVGNLPYEDKNGNKFNPLNTDCMGNMNNLLTKYNLFENLGLRSMNWQCRGVKKLDELTKLMEKKQSIIDKQKKEENDAINKFLEKNPDFLQDDTVPEVSPDLDEPVDRLLLNDPNAFQRKIMDTSK